MATLDERLGLNADFDATASETRGTKGERFVMMAFFALVMGPLLGARLALAWGATGIAAEAWILWASSARTIERHPHAARLHRLASTAAVSATWATMATLLWRIGGTPSRLAAVALLAIVMTYGARICYRAAAHLASSVAPAAITLLVLPLSYLGDWKNFILTEAACIVLTAYLARSGLAKLSTHLRLQETLAALVAEREAAQSASQAKCDFLATISHEIRNPLNGVLGMAQAMARDELPPEQHERLAVLQESGEAVLSLLNDLLDLSRIEAGRLELAEAPFDLGLLARSVQAAFEPACQTKGVALSVELDPSAEGRWLGDANRIRQIVSNLMSNAAKFTARGEVACRFRYAAPFLMIEVRDTGAGIPPHLLADLFDRYSKGAAGALREGGAGLGLSVVRQLAELMQGQVSVESAVGQGATFTVQLPLEPMSGEAKLAQAAEAAPATGVRVLAADDHKVNRLVLDALLGKAGLDATVVENAPMLISIWESAEVDVILLDLEMPLVDGVEAARRIRAREAALGRRRTPIVALTGNVMSQYAIDHRAADMDAVVAKPVQAEALLRTIVEVAQPAHGAEVPLPA